MKYKNFLVGPIVLLMLAVVACVCTGSGITGDPGTDGGITKPTEVPALFKDDFSSSSSGWTTGESDNASVDYVAEEYVVKVKTTDWFVWGNPGETGLSNIHLEVTARNIGGTEDTSFGIICNYDEGATSFYYAAIDTQGYYTISRTDSNTEDTFLTGGGDWSQSDGINKNAASYRVGLDCGSGKITLYVDGKQIDSVEDSTFSTGDVGLLAWTGENGNAEIHFDDFVVTALK